MKYAWIEGLRQTSPVRSMCDAIEVSRSGYYAWRRHKPGPRARRRARIAEAAESAHVRSHQIYGHRKVHEDLLELDDTILHCCEATLLRIMREKGLEGLPKKRFVRTTRADAFAEPAPNRLKRDFTARHPNEKWAADITYVWTSEGWLYLAVVLDLYSRRVIGWATSTNVDADLTCAAMKNALTTRQPDRGLIHHSDRGCQYTADSFQGILNAHGIQCSMSRKGDPWDNAPTESFMGSLKREWVNRRDYATRAEARDSLFQYIELFYNRQRRHAALGYKSPVNYEEQEAA